MNNTVYSSSHERLHETTNPPSEMISSRLCKYSFCNFTCLLGFYWYIFFFCRITHLSLKLVLSKCSTQYYGVIWNTVDFLSNKTYFYLVFLAVSSTVRRQHLINNSWEEYSRIYHFSSIIGNLWILKILSNLSRLFCAQIIRLY